MLHPLIFPLDLGMGWYRNCEEYAKGVDRDYRLSLPMLLLDGFEYHCIACLSEDLKSMGMGLLI